MPNTLRLVVVSALSLCVFASANVQSAFASVDNSQSAQAKKPVRAMTKKQRKLCQQAKPVRMSVIKKFGMREPGRDICVHGNGDGSMPSVKKLSSYLADRHRKLAPPPAPVST